MCGQAASPSEAQDEAQEVQEAPVEVPVVAPVSDPVDRPSGVVLYTRRKCAIYGSPYMPLAITDSRVNWNIELIKECLVSLLGVTDHLLERNHLYVAIMISVETEETLAIWSRRKVLPGSDFTQ